MRQVFGYDPFIGWRFIPNVQARVPHPGGGYLLRTSPQGFRTRHDLAEQSAKRQVLLFGESFTAADGVSDGARFSDIAEALVPEADIVNLAIPGTGPDQQYLTWCHAARHARADVVVAAIWVENIRRVVSRYRWFRDGAGHEQLFAKPWFELTGGRLELRGSPPSARPVPIGTLGEAERAHVAQRSRLPWTRPLMARVRSDATFERWQLQRRLVEPAQRLFRYQPVPEYDRPDDPGWLLLRAIVRRWAAELPCPMVLAPLPFSHHVLGTADAAPYQARFAELAAACEAVLFDPLPALQALDQRERRALYFAADGHPTPRWHRAVGEALAPVLRAQLARPAARTVLEGAR